MTSTLLTVPRHYLMCRPSHFAVVYAINPWMDTSIPVDRDLALCQWQNLVDAYRSLGHTVEVIEGAPGLPDMVFAANCGTVIGGKALTANMFSALRQGEQAYFRKWLADRSASVTVPSLVNEGQGDFTWTGRLLLAGSGFRTVPQAHLEAGEVLGVPVVSLQLVDPRFYHLDTCLFVVEDEQIAYYPAAFSTGSQEILTRLYPDAIVATEADALCLGLNAVSDGSTVVIASQATDLIDQLKARGYRTSPVDLSELLKAGGGVKCCTLELHP